MRRILLFCVFALAAVTVKLQAQTSTTAAQGNDAVTTSAKDALEFYPVAAGAVIFQGKGADRKPVATIMYGAVMPSDPNMTAEERKRLLAAYNAWSESRAVQALTPDPPIHPPKTKDEAPVDAAQSGNLYTDPNGQFTIEFSRTPRA